MSKIAIIADSGCQIDINGEHEGIYIAPLCIGHGSQTYLDQLEITSLDVFNQMKETDDSVYNISTFDWFFNEGYGRCKKRWL